jgi:hypothetical protein
MRWCLKFLSFNRKKIAHLSSKLNIIRFFWAHGSTHVAGAMYLHFVTWKVLAVWFEQQILNSIQASLGQLSLARIWFSSVQEKE